MFYCIFNAHFSSKSLKKSIMTYLLYDIVYSSKKYDRLFIIGKHLLAFTFFLIKTISYIKTQITGLIKTQIVRWERRGGRKRGENISFLFQKYIAFVPTYVNILEIVRRLSYE